MNLGKSKITPLPQAAEDYAKSLEILLPHLDFFVINVSSPNTPNLRALQDKSALAEILSAVLEIASKPKVAVATLTAAKQTLSGALTSEPVSVASKPILVKVAPDLSFEALDEILELAATHRIAGIVATNTTIARPTTANPEVRQVYAESGGLSGRPLAARSTEMIGHIYRQTEGKLPVIGVGGIFNAADAWEKITAGASLVQLYTGLVYEGPGVARSIVLGLLKRLEGAGLRDLREAIGKESLNLNRR
jgi:dihydroorotate dehydrogenase